MFETIHSFKSIPITKPNTLVICDIDNTVIFFKKSVFYFYNKLVDLFSEDFSNHELVDITKIMYETHKINNIPNHTDLYGYINLKKRLKDMSGNFCFLTARHQKSDEYTKKDLELIFINPTEHTIHYTNNEISKGEYTSKYIDLDGVEDLIFIDDMEENLVSFHCFFPTARCYKFDYQYEKIDSLHI
jgi:hypothetical protein